MMKKSEEFCEVAIEIFGRMKGTIPFDVYVQLADQKFTKVFNRNDKVDAKRFEVYAQKGAQTLYIQRKDRREYIGVTERLIKNITLQQKLSHVDASWAIEELSEQTLFEIYEDKIFDDETYRRAQEVTRSYVRLLKADMKVLTQFVQLARNETYMVRHSLSTSVVSLLVARACENSNDKMLEIISIGGLLHDIGMTKLPSDLNDLDRKLSQEEWAEVKKHPILGRDIVKEIKNCPEEVALVIEQHHENFNGTGYSKGLKGDEIYYPARIVAIADCFSALTTRRGGRSLFLPEEALSLMATEGGKYDPKILASFQKLLAPRKKKAA